jgi:hypothetical protein
MVKLLPGEKMIAKDEKNKQIILDSTTIKNQRV